MKTLKARHIAFVAIIAALIAATGCSTQKNTAKTRWWHSFTARYNTYYNGSVAYIDGSLEKENGNKDNFTELIPLYTVGNKASRDLGKSNFDRAIEKCQKAIKLHSIKRRPVWTKNRKKTEKDIEWLGRREYNPFLWKAWMLMGRSQFYKGDFDEAASTFSYMSRLYHTQPAIYGRARAWLAKCYVEEGWLYDAEDVIRNMQRDSIHWKAKKEWDYTFADYYIHAGDYEKAIPYLYRVIKHEMRRKQKAREWYLMGQLQAAVGNKALAAKAYKRVIRQNPPYEVEFNARIAITEVMSAGQSKKMVRRLRRMAASDKNKDYLDQVYYAIGNIYMAQKDTANAIKAYENGNSKATRGGIEKGVLLLRLGDIYWTMEKYSDAKRCYGEAIGLLDKERKDYEQLSERSKVLDELVPYTDAVHLQDSLQTLAKMDEKSRNEAIDRVIDELKRKEKEEKRLQDEQRAQEIAAQNGGNDMAQNNPMANNPALNQNRDGSWYFYNPMAVSQGKASFQKLWGKRENVDDWQRINKTVVASAQQGAELTDEQRDSIAQAAAVEDSLAQIADSAQNDPHRREYYLAQIPFTDEQKQASDKIIEDGLYNAGVIFKDKLDNLALSEKSLLRLVNNYPSNEHEADAYYHLFLLYSRKKDHATAESYVNRLKKEFPQNQWTVLLTDPHFKENALFGKHIEDSLYASTYNAFKAGRYAEVEGNANVSETRFPLGANRDKFIFIGGLGKLNGGDTEGCLANMNAVVEKYPKSRLSEIAGMIINGVKAGRRLRGGKFDLGDVWQRRAVALNDSDTIAAKKLSADRNAAFSFIIAYKPDSIDENKLLFQLAKYNFTSYMVRNFDISIDDLDGLHMMKVSGFRNYDEALQYARQFHAQASIMQLAGRSRMIIISDENLPLLGRQFSFDDYDKFYNKHFAPLKVSTFRLLAEPAEIMTGEDRNVEPTEEDIDKALDDGTIIDNGLDTTPNDNGTTIVPDNTASPASNQGATVVPLEPENNNGGTGTTVVPIENGEEKTNNEPAGATVIPDAQPSTPTKEKPSATNTTPANTQQKGIPAQQQPAKQPAATTQNAGKTKANAKTGTTATAKKDAKKLEDEFYFGDDDAAKPSAKTSKKGGKDNNSQKADDTDDEYYDLEGF